MASLSTPLDAAGAVTSPSSAGITLTATLAPQLFSDYAPVSFARMPGLGGPVFANGIDPLHHFINTVVYRTGILAPRDACTATPTGTRATATLNLDVSTDGAYNPSEGETIDINGTITFTASASLQSVKSLYGVTGVYVKIGSTAADTLTNLAAAVNQSGTQETEYVSITKPAGAAYVDPTVLQAQMNAIEVSASTSTTVTVRVKAYGPAGNSFTAYLKSGTWTDSSLGSTTTTVGTIGYFTSGAAGTGTAPEAGAYRYVFTRYRDADGAESGPSPYVLSEIGEDMNIDLDGMDQSEDTHGDYVWWYRTTTAQPVYFPGSNVARTAGTNDEDTDDIADDDLSALGAIPFDQREFRVYGEGFPEIVRYVVSHNGGLFGAGAIKSAELNTGTVSVTNASYQVTFTSYKGPQIIGRTLQIASIADKYRIVRWDDETTAQLDRAYEGSTNSTATYTLTDVRDPFAIYYSVPLKGNQWPADYQITGVTSDDPEGITGMISHGGALLVFTPTNIWRLTGDSPETFEVTKVVDGIGCVSGHTVVALETGLMFLGKDGVYAWDGYSAPVKISSRPTDSGQADGIDGTIDRIARRHVSLSFAHYDAEERVVRFFVPLDDAVSPSHALVFDLGSRCWSLDDQVGMRSVASVVGADGSTVVLQGDDRGGVWEYGVGTSDGFYGSEAVLTISSATSRALTLSGTPLSGVDAVGLPVWVVYADGDAVLSRIVANGSSSVTLEDALSETPAANDQIVIGGILMDLQTGRFDLGETYNEKVWKDMIVAFSPQADGQLHVATSVDQGDLAIPTQGTDYIDMTDTKGRRKVRVQKRGVLHGYRLACIEPGCEPSINRVDFIMQMRDQGDA